MKIIGRRLILKPKKRFTIKFYHGDCTLIDNHEGVEYLLDDAASTYYEEWDDVDWMRFIVRDNEKFWQSVGMRETAWTG